MAGNAGDRGRLEDRYRRDYSPAFLRFIAQRSESALRVAYELGRSAVNDRISLLALAHIHHELMIEVLAASRSAEELRASVAAASEFFSNVLAAYEMAQRGFAESQDAARAALRDQAGGSVPGPEQVPSGGSVPLSERSP